MFICNFFKKTNNNQSIMLREDKESIEKLNDMLPIILDLEMGQDGQPIGADTITIPHSLGSISNVLKTYSIHWKNL